VKSEKTDAQIELKIRLIVEAVTVSLSLANYQTPTPCPAIYTSAARKPRTSNPYLYTR
jgi:hypothetical protein